MVQVRVSLSASGDSWWLVISHLSAVLHSVTVVLLTATGEGQILIGHAEASFNQLEQSTFIISSIINSMHKDYIASFIPTLPLATSYLI